MRKLLFVLCLTGGIENLYAQDIAVASVQELEAAFRQAGPGDRIILAEGVYAIVKLKTVQGGTAAQPISLEAAVPGTAVINATGVEAISIVHPYWIVKGLTFQGQPHSDHAFHIAGDADHVVIKNNTLIDFNAQIKVNGQDNQFPDDGLIENNDIFNTGSRQTDLPVTTIDIVGGRNWTIRGNYIADFAKLNGNQTSYGVFLKGNSSQGVIEDNLIVCARNTQGGIRIGMSFGGGGTGQPFCEQQDCSTEHSGGQMRNNIVLNCSDVGIYLNKAKDTVIENNSLLMTAGIDVRFAGSSALINDNILTGGIRARDGGKIEVRKNKVFGSSSGIWLPSINAKLQSALAEFGGKLSSPFGKAVTEKAQNMIGYVIGKLEDSGLGLGRDKTLQCFPGLNGYDVSPDREKCGNFWLDNGPSSSSKDDFWGTPRSAGQNVMGAIDFYRSNCRLTNRIEHKPLPLPADCLR
ncbi:MAG: right-handed parallel beta-helix repeat-containing protein [Methylococcales bacterium]|nr:right-handed parallel beta-helix repeat-containing protein [Methylococcales bacterium]